MPYKIITEEKPRYRLEAPPIARTFADDLRDEVKNTDWLTRNVVGASTALSNAYLGTKGLFTDLSPSEQQTVDANKVFEQEAPAGAVVGNIAMALAPGAALNTAGTVARMPSMIRAGSMLMAPPSTLAGAGAAAGVGGTLGFIQPGDMAERMQNAGIAGTLGAAFPLAGMAFGGLKAAAEPLYEGGRKAIIGRGLRNAAGPGADDAIRNLERAEVLVPGSAPTAGEVSGNAGIAAMQRAAAGANPTEYAERALQQNAARLDDLKSIAGRHGERAVLEETRSLTADKLYGDAIKKGIWPSKVTPEIKAELDDILENPWVKDAVPIVKKMAQAEKIDLKTPQGIVYGLDALKKRMDSTVNSMKISGSIDANTERQILSAKERLVAVADQLSPDYETARKTFETQSKPLNRLAVGDEILKKSTSSTENAMGDPTVYIKKMNDALRDVDQIARRVTGFKGATADNTLDHADKMKLRRVAKDLSRAQVANDLGRGAGSNTFQNFAMNNLMEGSGLPLGLLNVPTLNRVGSWIYGPKDQLMKDALAQGLLDPKQIAALMRDASQRPGILSRAMRAGAPLSIGGALSLPNP